MTWSDGEPFTSDDIVFTYDLLRANPDMEWASEANGAVSSIDTPDPLTAVFNLTTPNPHFHLYREAFPAVQIWGGLTILPKHIWEKEADPLAFKNSNPIGTGPYVLDDGVAERHHLHAQPGLLGHQGLRGERIETEGSRVRLSGR